jgi:phosphate-selective porin OprO and OprP
MAVSAVFAYADDQPTPDVQQLLQRVKELEEKVKSLEQGRGTNNESAEGQTSQLKKEPPLVVIGSDGFQMRSADGDFGLNLRGVLQVDSRTFFSDHGIPNNDGFLLRRARPVLEGTVYRDFDFLFMPDFGTGNNGGGGGTAPAPQIYDAYLNYRYSPAIQFRIGKFKPPIGLERLQADAFLTFNERALATDLVPDRDLGFMAHGLAFDRVLEYAAGIFNGVGDYQKSPNSAFTDDKEFDGRLFLQPWRNTTCAAIRGIGFGVAGSYGTTFTAAGLPSTTGGTLPGYTTDGQQQFFAYNPTTGTVVANGEHWRLTPQTYSHWGPFALMGEYVISDQDVAKGAVSRRLDNKAWETTASWVLTGEDNNFNGVVPLHPFKPGLGQWGAWELAARYGQLDIDKGAFPIFSNPSTSASSAVAWSVGLNWWLNKNIRIMTSFARTTFTGGGGTATSTTAPGEVTRQPENVFFTRAQLAF